MLVQRRDAQVLSDDKRVSDMLVMLGEVTACVRGGTKEVSEV